MRDVTISCFLHAPTAASNHISLTGGLHLCFGDRLELSLHLDASICHRLSLERNPAAVPPPSGGDGGGGFAQPVYLSLALKIAAGEEVCLGC